MEHRDASGMQALELRDVVDLGIDDDPLQLRQVSMPVEEPIA